MASSCLRLASSSCRTHRSASARRQISADRTAWSREESAGVRRRERSARSGKARVRVFGSRHEVSSGGLAFELIVRRLVGSGDGFA
jgi:hypothetical protein